MTEVTEVAVLTAVYGGTYFVRCSFSTVDEAMNYCGVSRDKWSGGDGGGRHYEYADLSKRLTIHVCKTWNPTGT